MLTYRLADYEDFKEEAELLRQMHYLEAMQPRGAGYGVAHDFYEQLGDAVRIIMAYDDENVVGYIVTIVSDDVHDEDSQVAQTTLYYIHPDHRKGWNGVHLFRLAEADLAAFAPGCTWRLTTPTGPLDRGAVFRYLGLGEVERVYEKRIGGADDDGRN